MSGLRDCREDSKIMTSNKTAASTPLALMALNIGSYAKSSFLMLDHFDDPSLRPIDPGNSFFPADL